jgi:hypothetical protein
MGSSVELNSGRGLRLSEQVPAVSVGPGLFRKYCENLCQAKLVLKMSLICV